MRSSTSSSSSTRYWAWVCLFCALVAVSLCASVETYWRSHGYEPGVIDSKLLWAEQRDRVYERGSRRPFVLLGASRIQFGIDIRTLKDALPRYRPVMLAINGHYPLAALHDLAEDENFNGVVLCDIDARGLSAAYRDMQQPYVDYYHQRWTPSWRAHRRGLTFWQNAAVIANPDFGLLRTLIRWWGDDAGPWKSHVQFYANRSGDADFSKVDTAQSTKGFADEFKRLLTDTPPPPPEQWLASLADVRGWVEQIQARGGEVIFYDTPTSGKLREYANSGYPKSLYWDRFAAMIGAPTLSYTDIPALEDAPLADGSHLDFHDKPDYTRALVDALVDRGWLQR
ncbi:MAG: hypothetical protein ABI127_03580 [Dokdonella sp.]